ncbi:MAG: 2OG-Fe(II) oxygenase [Chitinophagales bacterium]
MNTTFDYLINSFIENKVGLAENFLSEALAANLRANLLALHSSEQMKAAGIGNNAKFTENKLVRSDVIYWLDRQHNDTHENSFFDLMDEFVTFLNRTCYAGITGYEFHYALYEKGSFYKRHLDQFKDNNSRAFSMIMYLNVDWKEGDGGELCIYNGADNQKISPLNSKCVFFKSSELEHEVLVSHQQRMSVTGWLKCG